MDLDKELQKYEIEFKKGFSKPLILFTLAEKPDYPFQISKTVREMTKDKISIVGSNIYPILTNMEKSGIIQGIKEEESRKRVYSLTGDGKDFLTSLQQTMKEFVDIIQEMIDA